jgi:O-antigen/teichoic acid export membrane protein
LTSNSEQNDGIGKILRGTAWLTVTSILSKILLLFFFVYLSNALGKEKLGRFAFLLDSAYLFFIATDMGLGFLLVLKLSRTPRESEFHVSHFLGLRLGMMIPFILFYGGFLYFYGQGADWRMAQALAVSYFALHCVWDLFRSIIRGWERMDLEAFSTLAERLAFMGGGVLILLAGFRLTGMMVAAQISILLSFGLIVYWVLKRGIRIRPRWDFASWPALLRETLPFGLGALCIVALYREDTLMLNWLVGDEETGRYHAAFRLMEGGLLIPQAISLAAYPTFSRLFHQGQSIQPAAEKLLRWLLVFGFPLAVGGALVSPQIIGFFEKEYADSAPVLQWLLLALPALYLNYLAGTVLRSIDLQIRNLHAALVALVTNFGLNLLLIPRLGAVGAAVATISTQVVYFLVMYYFIRLNTGGFRLRTYLPQLVVVTAVMAALVYPVREMSLAVSVPIGIIIFTAGSWLLGLMKIQDFRQLIDLVKKKEHAL